MKGVYIFQLENGMWYIGKSKRIEGRFKAHAQKYNENSITAQHEVEDVAAVFRVEKGTPRLVHTEEFIAGRMAERHGLDRIEGGTMSGKDKTRIRKKSPSYGFIEAIQGTDWEWLGDGTEPRYDEAEWSLDKVAELSQIFVSKYAEK